MRIQTILTGLLLWTFTVAQAQNILQSKGSLIYTLGPDTSAIGNFELDGSDFKLTVVSMSPRVNVSTLRGSFFPNGELKHVEGNNYDPDKAKDSLNYEYKLYYEKDTTFIESGNSKRKGLRKYPVKIMVANSLGGDALIFMPALLANFVPARVNDSIVSSHIVFNSARKFIIKRTGDRKLMLGSAVMGMFTLYVDDRGKIQSIDGIGTSFNVKGTAVHFLNIDSVIMASLKRQRVHPQLTVINKSDSLKTTINGVEIKINYSRPSMRKREIFGYVVPWNRIWRTGADAATKISIKRSIYFAGKELPAGTYSIFTIPSPDGWKLIFNKQFNIWGTEHNATYDFLTVPMQTQFPDKPVELLTFSIDPAVEGEAALSISWEKVKATAVFSTK